MDQFYFSQSTDCGLSRGQAICHSIDHTLDGFLNSHHIWDGLRKQWQHMRRSSKSVATHEMVFLSNYATWNGLPKQLCHMRWSSWATMPHEMVFESSSHTSNGLSKQWPHMRRSSKAVATHEVVFLIGPHMNLCPSKALVTAVIFVHLICKKYGQLYISFKNGI